MNSKEYVKNHNFGYGQDKVRLHKLKLRNLDDLKVYLKDIIDITFVAKVDNFQLNFDGILTPLEIMVEEI